MEGMDNNSHKSGYVALVGKPNVGKSTFLNHYLGQKIAATSPKPQTTQRRQLGILTLPGAQIIFVDTPGLHTGDFRLSQFINQEARLALGDADLLLFMVDASQPPESEDQKLAEEIIEKAGSTPKLLVMNKIDQASPERLQINQEAYQTLLDFDAFVMISVITAQGRDDLLTQIIAMLPEGPVYFPEEQITATNEREIAGDLIRAAAMQQLRDELPYVLFVRVNEYTMRDEGIRYIHATIFVERDSHKGIVIGKGGRMIKKISTLARQDIEAMSGESVFLDLKVKVEKNWRNNPEFLRRHGLSND